MRYTCALKFNADAGGTQNYDAGALRRMDWSVGTVSVQCQSEPQS